ncbi:MAG: hypothetical protein M3373_01695 [Gemmatimonadota bacterium]|nr:hypothetical protein [Gemmatimonadota bacterium]
MLRPYARIYLYPVQFCERAASMLEGKSGPLDAQSAAGVAHEIGVFLEHARYANLDLAVLSAMRLRSMLEGQRNIPDVRLALLDLAQRISDELAHRRFFYVNNQLAPFYEEPLAKWGDVADKFPSALLDAEEAGKCFALGRNTACVFHLMRVMEVALRALGASLNDPTLDPKANPTWDRILKRGDNELLKNASRRSSEWQTKDVFFTDAIANLRAVKTAWRNPTMHVHGVYDSERAQDIFNAVRGLMRHLASELHE